MTHPLRDTQPCELACSHIHLYVRYWQRAIKLEGCGHKLCCGLSQTFALHELDEGHVRILKNCRPYYNVLRAMSSVIICVK